MREFAPRPCQVPMIETMCSLPRANVFASPGTGKTTATLFALQSLSLLDSRVFPALVVAPKRVANGVWDAEVESWAAFNGLKVSKMLGAEKHRRAAAMTAADIFTINPENLQWLDRMLDGRWPFNTVISDESTILKNHRCHFRRSSLGKWTLVVSGTLRARSLVRHALATPHWYNLTGTPSPNGLTDLWGQHWPIDFGEALGSSFTAFKQRWFRPEYGSTPEQQRIAPLPGAEDEILSLMAPKSVVIDAYDWFDIARPVERDMLIDLPPKAKKLYDKLHKESVAILESLDTITAANAGSIVMKCRQIASGHIRDDDGTWHSVHEEKLDALGELMSELNGQPLLCAYYFKEDLVAIKKRFPFARELPNNSKQKEVQDEWNAGKIPLLLVHPQSSGHGLNLQHGGNNLCMYTMDWNAEYYWQVIERMGPTRQAQSGYNRPVFIHRIIGRKTWEEVVATALRNKLSLDKAVKLGLLI